MYVYVCVYMCMHVVVQVFPAKVSAAHWLAILAVPLNYTHKLSFAIVAGGYGLFDNSQQQLAILFLLQVRTTAKDQLCFAQAAL